MHTKFCLEHLKGKDHLEDVSRVGNIRLDLRAVGWRCVDWMHQV
jgi:hypothetical protein